jgi:hypothetical protein
MRKVVLFSTYCDTLEKEEALLQNIAKVRELDCDVMVLTILPLTDRIQEAADFVICSKENPIPEIDDKSIYSWNLIKNDVMLLNFHQDYGYASLLQLKRLLQFSSLLKYERYFTMIYDIVITPEIERVILEGRECSFFKNSKIDIEISGILMAFDHEHALRFSSLLTERSYYTDTVTIAESWIENVRIAMGGELEDINATDSIEYGMTYLRADQSIFKDLGIFLERDRVAGIMLYYIDSEKTIGIETNFGQTEITISEDVFIELTEEPESLTLLKIKYLDEELDLTYSYLRIKKSVVQNYLGEKVRPFS